MTKRQKLFSDRNIKEMFSNYDQVPARKVRDAYEKALDERDKRTIELEAAFAAMDDAG